MITTNIAFARAKHLVCETFLIKAVEGVDVQDFTWECPLGVTDVEVELWGAGGHGGQSSYGTQSATGGRAGQKVVETVCVVQGEKYPIYIGRAAKGLGENKGNGEASTAFSLVANGGEAGKPDNEGVEYSHCYGETGYQLGGVKAYPNYNDHSPVTRGGIAAGGHASVKETSYDSEHRPTMGGDGICIIKYYV